MLNYKHCSRTHTATKQKCQTGILRSAKLFQLFHIYDFHISTIIIRHLDGSFGSNIMTTSQVSQRSWVQIPYGPDFFSGLISTTSSVVFIAARISYIRFFTAMHTYDFHISTIIIVPTCPSIWLETTSKKSLLWILLFQPLFSLFRLKFDDKFCDTSYNCFLPPELQNVLRRNHESCGRILQKLAGEIERLNTRLESSNSPTSKQQPIESMQSQHDAILIRKLQQRNTRAAKTTFLIVSFFRGLLATSFISDHHVQWHFVSEVCHRYQKTSWIGYRLSYVELS